MSGVMSGRDPRILRGRAPATAVYPGVEVSLKIPDPAAELDEGWTGSGGPVSVEKGGAHADVIGRTFHVVTRR